MFVREPQEATLVTGTSAVHTPQQQEQPMLVLESGSTGSADATLLPK